MSGFLLLAFGVLMMVAGFLSGFCVGRLFEAAWPKMAARIDDRIRRWFLGSGAS